VGVDDDGCEYFALSIEAMGFVYELAFALVIAAFVVDLEGFAEDA